jgi:hypothetical protein
VKTITFDLKPSENLKKLVSRVETREWLLEEIPKVRGYIQEARHEINAAEHIPQCEQCLLTSSLDVERYMGTRSVWWLDLENLDVPMEWEDEETNEEMKRDPYMRMFLDMPRMDNYEIGCYGHESEDTKRFIKDRCTWAKGVLTVQIERAKQYYLLLIKWDFKPETKEKAEALLETLLSSSPMLNYSP